MNPPATASERVRKALFAERRWRARIDGRSMRPLLKPGDTAMLRPVPDSGPVPGRCYAYLSGGKLILHRLARAGGGMAVLVGDSIGGVSRVPQNELVGELDDSQATLAFRLVEYFDRALLPWGFRSAYFLKVRRLALRLIFQRQDLHDEKRVPQA